MPLETATYITDLVSSNPGHSDGLSQADSHLRMLKSTLKATFPNFTSAALNSTQAQIDAIAALLVSGQLTGNGAVPPGQIADFGGTTAPTGWLICDGQAVSRTTYAALFAYIGTTWGVGDGSTTFNVPGLQSYFRRHRDGNASLAGAVGNKRNPANLSHTHNVAGNTGTDSGDHTHSFSGTTGTMSANNVHTHTINGQGSIIVSGAGGAGVGGGSFGAAGSNQLSNSSVDINHGHAFSGTTSGISANHYHAFNVNSGGGTADDANEARPYSAAVLTCIKT